MINASSTKGRQTTDRGSSVLFPAAETFALLCILIIGLVAIIGISILTNGLESKPDPRQSGNQMHILTTAEAVTAYELALELMNQSSGSPASPDEKNPVLNAKPSAASEWTTQLEKDPTSLAVFILHVVTSPDYLRKQKDDAGFTKDVWSLLTAVESPDASGQAETMPVWTADQSRVVWLQSALQTKGFYSDGLASPHTSQQKTGRLKDMLLQESAPKDGSVVFGRRAVAGSVRIDQADNDQRGTLTVRQTLFLDGRLHQTNPAIDQTSADQLFSLQMDVRGQLPGVHQAEVFILSSDGRGLYQDMGSLQVPVITSLSANSVLEQTLLTTSQTGSQAASRDRYAAVLPDETEAGLRYALTIAGVDGPIAAELFNLDGKQLAISDNRDNQWEGLRAIVPSDENIPVADRIAYALISRSDQVTIPDTAQADAVKPAISSTIHYTIVQADTVAVSRSKPEKLYALVERREDGLVLQGTDGQQITRKASDVRTVEFAARLSELTITYVNGLAPVYPAFDPETTAFGLYLPAGSGSLSIHASAKEGNFATVTVSNQSESSKATALDKIDTFIPAPSDNTLVVTVKNGDDLERIYRVHILLTPQKDGYHQVLETFPEDYRSPLYLLHVQQPSYQFVLDQTNLTYAEFLDAETFKDRSLVDTSSAPLNWVLPGSPVYDGKYWKAAARKVVAYYSDPRNFLSEQDIFQFETLRFQESTHKRAGINAIIAGTFMAPGHEKNPDKVDYASLLLSAGEKAGISPLFLAAKIIQEMGRNGASPLAFGKLAGYEGAYNFYNIGSTPDPSVTNGAQINGALYALYGRNPEEKAITADEEVFLLPWTTPERAVTGGAIWIASRYITIGQDTLYLQKFDLVAADGLYIHQYAQNIQMAYAEGRRTYTAYKDMDLLNEAFVFRIPVFGNMPAVWSALPS